MSIRAVVVALSLLVGTLSTPLVGQEENYAPSWSPQPVDGVIAELQDLDFDAFVDRSYWQYMLRFPEQLTYMGVAEAFGVRNDRMNDYSDDYVRDTQRLEAALLAQLQGYDRAALSSQQRLTYDVYGWYLDDLVRAHPFMYYDYPASDFYVTSCHFKVYDLLTEAHPIVSVRDVEDYIARLCQVGTQFDQVIEGLALRAEAGIVAPQSILTQGVRSIAGFTRGRATSSPFYKTLSAKLEAVDGISNQQRTDYLRVAEKAIDEVVIPAYKRLYDAASGLVDIAPEQIGYWQYPRGHAYYAHILRHHNQTQLTADEIHDIGLREVERVEREIREIASALGISNDASIAQIFELAARDGGTLYGAAVVEEYDRMIEAAKAGLTDVISPLPVAEVIVKGSPVGGYYTPPARDGSRPGAFYAPTQGPQPRYSMPTLAYHETVPGHHVQLSIAQELDIPLVRTEEEFLGHIEGWALYAERLAWELGWYEDDFYGNLGRLQDEMMRAVRLVVDTGIHAEGWDSGEAVSYFAEHTGQSRGYSQYQINRYAAWPGQATAYMLGRLKIQELRERAENALGDRFDLSGFHDVVLRNGNLPLSVLERLVDAYIAEGLAG